jgi:signal transduction histidine kinase
VGYTEDELLSMEVMDIHPPEALSRVSEDFETLAQGRQVTSEGIPAIRKDGSLFYADISTSLVTYNGRPCSTGFFRDITERKKAEEVLRREYRVLRQMLNAQDRERQLMAYEIHDGLAQKLAGAAMQFEAFGHLQSGNPQQASDCFSAGLHLLKESVSEARRLIAGLRPPILDEAGIVAAIAHLIHDVMAQDGPAVEFHSSIKSKRLEPLIENAIFRIVQESLSNVRRHSKSDRAEIGLVQDGDRIRVEVQDWGIGFDPESVEESCFGLAGIRERARVLGGKATIESQPGEGAKIVVELPVAMSESDQR